MAHKKGLPNLVSMETGTLLQAALQGLEARRREVADQMAEVQGRLVQYSRKRASKGRKQASRGRKRTLSPAARKRIGDAQKKRWAAYRKQRRGVV